MSNLCTECARFQDAISAIDPEAVLVCLHNGAFLTFPHRAIVQNGAEQPSTGGTPMPGTPTPDANASIQVAHDINRCRCVGCFADLYGELDALRLHRDRLIADLTSTMTNGPWFHSCMPLLTNPTREEAIEALRKIVRELTVTDWALGNVERARGIAEAALPKTERGS